MKIRNFLVLLPLGLCGCQAIGDWFDSVGEHMPVIGQRCEHWQCFTSSGQEASEEKKEKLQQPIENPPASANPTSARIPANAPQTLAPQPASPAAPASGVAMPEYESPSTTE